MSSQERSITLKTQSTPVSEPMTHSGHFTQSTTHTPSPHPPSIPSPAQEVKSDSYPPTSSNTHQRRNALIAIGGVIITLGGGGSLVYYSRSHNSSPSPIRFGFTPSSDRDELAQKAQSLADALESKLGREVKIRVGESYQDTIETFGNKELDVVWFSPLSYVVAKEKYGARTILRRLSIDGQQFYNSYILTQRSTHIQKMSDLKGRKFSFVDPNSASGYLFPRYAMKKADIDDQKDIRGIFAGGHDKSLLLVITGEAAAGAISSNIYKSDKCKSLLHQHGLSEQDIVTIHTSDPIPTGAIAVQSYMSEDEVFKIKQAFLAVNEKTILRTLDTEGFVDIGSSELEDKKYDSIRSVAHELNIDLSKDINKYGG